MNDGGKQLARTVGAALTVARWVLTLILLLFVPATIISVFLPGGLSIAALLSGAGRRGEVPGAYSAGSILAYASGNLALALVIVMALRQMMRTVSAGQPFDPANTVRLRRIAAAMAGLALLATLVRPMIPALARSARHLATPDLNLGLWLGALVVLVLAEIFREGTRLREDADMTI